MCVLVRVSLLRPCVSRQLFRLGNLQTNHKKKAYVARPTLVDVVYDLRTTSRKPLEQFLLGMLDSKPVPTCVNTHLSVWLSPLACVYDSGTGETDTAETKKKYG